jgi:hypothetical protein
LRPAPDRFTPPNLVKKPEGLNTSGVWFLTLTASQTNWVGNKDIQDKLTSALNTRKLYGRVSVQEKNADSGISIRGTYYSQAASHAGLFSQLPCKPSGKRTDRLCRLVGPH